MNFLFLDFKAKSLVWFIYYFIIFFLHDFKPGNLTFFVYHLINSLFTWLQVNSSSSNIEDVANKLKEQTGTENLGAGDLKKVSDIITKMGRGFKIPGSVDKKEKREKLEKFSKVEFMGFIFTCINFLSCL